jgi:hypothetical protein
MKYTYDDMLIFYSIYDSSEYGNRYSFIEKMKEFDISEELSTIIWQAFDMGVERTYLIFRDKGMRLEDE